MKVICLDIDRVLNCKETPIQAFPYVVDRRLLARFRRLRAGQKGPSLPDETIVASGAWTVTIRQIAPWRAGSQHPADTI
jgi:hypothetical protein